MAQLPAEIPAGGFEARQGLLGIFPLQKADIHLGIAQIRGGFYPGDGDHGVLHSGVLDGPQKGGQLLHDLLIDSIDTIGCHIVILLAL